MARDGVHTQYIFCIHIYAAYLRCIQTLESIARLMSFMRRWVISTMGSTLMCSWCLKNQATQNCNCRKSIAKTSVFGITSKGNGPTVRNCSIVSFLKIWTVSAMPRAQSKDAKPSILPSSFAFLAFLPTSSSSVLFRFKSEMQSASWRAR